MARRFASRSATMIISPMGVSIRSINSSRTSDMGASPDGAMGVVGRPEVLGSVGAPRAPGFGAIEKAGWGGACSVDGGCAAKQTDVGRGECVHLAKCA